MTVETEHYKGYEIRVRSEFDGFVWNVRNSLIEHPALPPAIENRSIDAFNTVEAAVNAAKEYIDGLGPAKVSASDLKRRGWTEAMISRLLGTPDERQPNPYYPSAGTPMRLYLSPRVEAAEASPEFRQWSERNRARRQLHAATH
jgi:hypothetical protein